VRNLTEEKSIRAGAIIVAAGKGERMGLGEAAPKALIELEGRPLAWHSLAKFESEPRIKAIALVVPPGTADRCREEIVEKWKLHKVSAIVDGGLSRQESVRLGLDALAQDLDPVLIHDAARPLVTAELVSLCLEMGAASGACVPAIPIAGTVKAVSPQRQIQETVDRTGLWEAQTPQAFASSLIRQAHRRAKETGLEGTDDSSLVEALGTAVTVVQGSPENLKVTWPVDLEVARAILKRRRHGG